MKEKHLLIDMNDAVDAIFKFIGTDEFYKVVECLQDDSQSAFTAGLSFAMAVVMSKCDSEFYKLEEQPKFDKRI